MSLKHLLALGSTMTTFRFAKKQLSQSMLTGVPQIMAARGPYRKLVKTTVLFGCLIGCAYQVWSFMQVYWTYPTIVDVIVSNPSVFDLPAVTLCEHNGIRAENFCKRFKTLCTPYKSYRKFCAANFKYCNEGYFDEPPRDVKVPAIAPPELRNINVSMKGFRNYLKFLGTKEYAFVADITYDHRKVANGTQLGVFNGEGVPTNCYAYNVLWDKPNITQPKATTRDEYKILTRMHGGDYFYNSTPLAIQMMVHSPFAKLNPFVDGFSVKPCTTYKMYLEKTENKLLPAPYPTNCRDYMKTWIEAGGKGPLTKKMCVDDCTFNKSMELFDCFNPFYVTYPDEENLFCFGRDKILDEEALDECDRSCQHACYEESIKVNIEEFETSLTSNQVDKKSCLTGITISFTRTQVQKFIYSKKYEVIEAFGYVGGFLGMWLGLSLIAVFDFVEMCFVILSHLATKIQRNKKTQIQRMKNIKIKHMFIA